MITPECCFTMWRAAARAVMNCDFTTVVSGTINSSIARSTAFFPFPYSFTRGPTALNTMSMLPVCFMMQSMYSLTAASSRALITAACTRPPAAVICFVTSSTLGLVRPARKTSAPSAANSFATAAPIEPPAPNTTACFSCRIGELLMDSSIDLSFCFRKIPSVLSFRFHDVRRALRRTFFFQGSNGHRDGSSSSSFHFTWTPTLPFNEGGEESELLRSFFECLPRGAQPLVVNSAGNQVQKRNESEDRQAQSFAH